MSEVMIADFGFKDLNQATVHVLQEALERKVITATEIAALVPRGVERDPEKFSLAIRFIRKTLADNHIRLVADKEAVPHLKQHPIARTKTERGFRSSHTPNAPGPELNEIEKEIGYVKDRGEDYEYDVLKMYYNDIYRYRLLTAEEEVDLAKRIANGDLNARNTLVKHNLRLVRWVASKFAWSTMPFEDLIQEGNLGLITAAEKFDHRPGHRFTTYAHWWVRQAIGRAISNGAHLIRIPVHMLEIINKIRKIQREIERETGRAPTEDEIAKCADLPRKMVRRTLTVYTSMSEPVSMDEEISGITHSSDDTPTFGELLPDTTTIGPEMYLEALEELTLARIQLEKTEKRVAGIAGSERNLMIFNSFYGLDDGTRKTLEGVAKQYGLTRERIRQIIEHIWKKVDEAGGDMDHRYFLEELSRVEELEKIVLSAQ